MANRIDADLEVTGGLALSGTMTSGSVPAARINSGTLAVARAWAYAGGDVTGAAGSAVLTIAPAAVTNAKMATMAQATFKGRAAGAGTGAPADLTAAQAKTALAITTADVSGLGTMATQAANNVAISGGFANLTQSSSITSTGTTLYLENSSVSFNGDVLQLIGVNATGANFYLLRAYNSGGMPIAGWRGDGAVFAAVQVSAPNVVTPATNKGTVTTTVAFDFRQSQFQTVTLTNGTACNASVTAAPQGPCQVWIKVIAPASGTSPAMTWPASFKGGWPTTVTTIGRYNLLEGYFDGTSYNYLSGALNIA